MCPFEVKALVDCLFYLVSFKSLVAMFLSMITLSLDHKLKQPLRAFLFEQEAHFPHPFV